ncbi:hypothetical protein ACEUAI_21055 [Aeromonas veronii]
MLMFSGKKGFKIRCLIAVLFFVLSHIAISLVLPHFDAVATKLESSANNSYALILIFFISFPVLFFVSSSIVLGHKIKASLGRFLRFALTSILVFIVVMVSLLDYKAKEINASMVVGALKELDKPTRELISHHMEAFLNMSYATFYCFVALFVGLSIMNLWHFSSFVRKVSRDAGALYNAIPDELSN